MFYGEFNEQIHHLPLGSPRYGESVWRLLSADTDPIHMLYIYIYIYVRHYQTTTH